MHSFKSPLNQPTDCPVCGEPYLVFVTHKRTIRTKRDLPLYGCLACQSFSNPSGYTEDDEQLAKDLEWHKSVSARNEKASVALFKGMKKAGVDFSKIVEIGAGTGTLLKVARDQFGASGIGYEVNPLTQPYARTHNNVDVRAEFWTADTPTGPFSVMISIMVLEHIPEPRPLVENMVKACLNNNAALFISVPFVDHSRWSFIFEDDPRAPGNPFFDQDVHVTHYSPQGLEKVLCEFGMKEIKWLREGLWHGILARP